MFTYDYEDEERKRKLREILNNVSVTANLVQNLNSSLNNLKKSMQKNLNIDNKAYMEDDIVNSCNITKNAYTALRNAISSINNEI